MNKLYVNGNYVIAEDSRGVHEYPTSRSVYSVVSNPAGYVIKEQIDSGELVILTADIPNWFDESGTIAYTEATLVAFLRENTANFNKGGASTFEDLTDTPSYAGNGLKGLRINAAEDGIEPYVATDLNQWLIKNVAFVNPLTGDDDTAVIGDGNLPFRTLQGAILSVGTKVLYYCMPGTYTGTITLETGDYYFMPGCVMGTNSRIQDGGSFKDVRIYGHLEVSRFSYGFSFTGLQSIATIELDSFKSSRSIVFADGQECEVYIKCRTVRCRCDNGGGYAVRVREGSSVTLDVSEKCETYHWLVAGGFGAVIPGVPQKFTINCQDIRILTLSVYGNAFKALINDQGQSPCIYNVNGFVTHEVTSTTTAFGIVESALVLYVNKFGLTLGSEFHYKGGCLADGQPVVLAYYRIVAGVITLNDGDYKSQQSIGISSFAGSLNNPANIEIKAKNIRLEGFTRAFQTGYGRTLSFEQCSLYVTDPGGLIVGNVNTGNSASGTPNIYFYNCIAEHVSVGLGSEFLSDATLVSNFNTINTISNLPIGSPGVVDGWLGYSQIVGFTIPKI